MIEFFDNRGVIGTIEYVDNNLVADVLIADVAQSWINSGSDPADFENFYARWTNGYISARRIDELELNDESDALIAAAREDKVNGAMIALVPRDVEQLALDGYEEPDELHLTLFFLGDADEITPTQVNELVTDLMQLVRTQARSVPIFAQAFGVAHWNPESEYPAWVLNVGDKARDDPSGLTDLRVQIEDVLRDTGIDYPPQHSPWQPHICLAYSAEDLYGKLADKLGPVTFDTLRVAWGKYDIDIPLMIGDVVVADAVGIEALHLSGRHNQKSHGNRKGKSDNITSDKTKSSTNKSKTPSVPKKSFAERVADAKTGAQALQSAPVHNNKTLRAATTVEKDAYPGARYKVESDAPLNGVPGDKVRDAVSDYAGNGYANINWALRESAGDDDAIPDTHPTKPGTYSGKRAKDGITGIDAAMKASPLENDVVVYRGIADPTKTFGSAWRSDGDNSGLRFVDNSYASTTVSKTVAGTFAGYGAGVKMNILVPKGTRAIGIEQSRGSGLSHEQEMLLDRKLTYNIVRDYEEKGVRTVDVEVS